MLTPEQELKAQEIIKSHNYKAPTPVASDWFSKTAPKPVEKQEPGFSDNMKSTFKEAIPAIGEIQQGIQNVKNAPTLPEKITAGGEALFSAPMAEIGKVLEPISWLAKQAQEISKPLTDKLGQLLASAIPESAKQSIKNTLSSPEITKIADKINQFADTPEGQQASKDFNNALGYLLMGIGGQKAPSDLGSGLSNAKAGFETAADTGISAAKTELGAVKGAMEQKAITKIPSTVGKITQALPEELPTATRALSGIDTKGVKTYADLSSKLDSTIKSNQSTVDAKFSEAKGSYFPEELTQKITSGKTTIKQNFVSDALSNLKELYGKTKDAVSQAKIMDLEAKYKAEGLTPSEINNLAKEYGTEFKNKAFSKVTGDPLTSTNAQAFENTRTGIKETARGLIEDESVRLLDKSTSDIIKTKQMTDDMATKVQQLQNKFEKAGLLQRAGNLISTGVNLVTGGIIKGFFKNMMGMSGEGKTLNPIELQNRLAKNLKLLDELNKLDPKAAAEKIKASNVLGAYNTVKESLKSEKGSTKSQLTDIWNKANKK